jgi:hypothetical protein
VAKAAALNPAYGKLEADKALDAKRPNIALSCIRLPQDESIYRWLASSANLVVAPAGAAAPKGVTERKAVSASRAEVELLAPQPRVIPLQLVQP